MSATHWSATLYWPGKLRRFLRPQPLGALGLALSVVLLGLLLAPPLIPYDAIWEAAAAAGYGACLAAVLTFRIAPSAATPATNRRRWMLHRIAGWAMLTLVALHVAVMLIGDPFMLDYIGWMMPRHILVGVVATLALLLAVATREPALRAALGLGRWPPLHRWASIAAAGFAGIHVFTSTGKLVADWRFVLLGSLFAALLAPVTLTLLRRRRPRVRRSRKPRTGAAPPAGWRQIGWLLAGLGAATLLVGIAPMLARLVGG